MRARARGQWLLRPLGRRLPRAQQVRRAQLEAAVAATRREFEAQAARRKEVLPNLHSV